MPYFFYILLLVNLASACQNGVESEISDRPVAAPAEPVMDDRKDPKEERSDVKADLKKPAEIADSSVVLSLDGLSEDQDSLRLLRDQVNSTPGTSPTPKAEKPNIVTISKATSGDGPAKPIYTRWDALFADMDLFFGEAVTNGLVHYGELAVSPATLNDLIRRISEADLGNATDAENKAFRLNAYNLLVIHQVVEHYPIASPMDIAGFFNRNTFSVAGKQTTLNDLETGLRSDPRIHFALVCAALGCPKIQNEAFLPATLEDQLNECTKSAIDNPRFIRFQQGDQRAELSQIFNWYAGDFGGSDAVLVFINRYRTNPIPVDIPLSFYEYNWKLNKAS